MIIWRVLELFIGAQDGKGRAVELPPTEQFWTLCSELIMRCRDFATAGAIELTHVRNLATHISPMPAGNVSSGRRLGM